MSPITSAALAAIETMAGRCKESISFIAEAECVKCHQDTSLPDKILNFGTVIGMSMNIKISGGATKKSLE